MNQIIKGNLNNNKKETIKIEFGNEITEIPYGANYNIQLKSKNKHIKNFVIKRRYELQFILSFSIAVIFLVFLFWKLYQNDQQEKIAKELLNTYQLTTLYSDSSNYDVSKLNSNLINQAPFVIGMIKIDKINLSYPILSESNDNLLKMSVCRFAGPMPNEVGNLCIAGHNYLDNRFFGRLDELEYGDKIQIYGLTGKMQSYIIFQKYEVDATNLACTSQNVGNTKIVTLLTCDNSNDQKRIVIQAKQ